MATVFLGLGSNLGRREHHLRRALTALTERLEITATSPVYETRPMYVAEQPRFLNMVARAETEMAPRPLMAWLKRLEAALGRTPAVRFGPRAIDLDILFYDRVVIDTPGLKIPHPRLAERAFVLRPLVDLAPDWVHPVTGRRVEDMLAALGDCQGSSIKHRTLEWRPAPTD
ncbi:MAG: 2-amino-4-hydroxy-6-hydroxymethyldihydropteridine diphosphokinase [Kiloniellales bacterium]